MTTKSFECEKIGTTKNTVKYRYQRLQYVVPKDWFGSENYPETVTITVSFEQEEI